MDATEQAQATRSIAGWSVTALPIGRVTASFGLLQGIDEAAAKAVLRDAGRGPEPIIDIYAFLLREEASGRAILVDGGLAGQLDGQLDRAGCAPGEVGTILLTHAHSDHVGGLLREDGTAAFPDAEVVCSEAELAFWSSDERRAAMPEDRRASFDGARRFFDVYRSRLRTVREGEVAPGISLVPLPGHTPGHSGFRIGRGSDELLIWADIVHVPVIQLARPEVTVAFDVEPEVAAATRKRLLPEVAAAGTLVAGMHLEPPGFMTVRQVGSGYAAA